MNRLEGRVALVTGAASGIGRASALRLADEGATVVATDIQDEAGGTLVSAISEAGGTATYLHHDVSQEQDWIDVIARTEELYGRLDILLNNAGVGDLLTIEDATFEDYHRIIAITQDSVFLGMKYAAPLLKASGHGSVINISSIFGASGGFGGSPGYHAAKGAVRLMTKNAALLWATQGVRVNSIHPGFIDTPILAQAKGTEIEQLMTGMTPMGRLGLSEEVAAGVAYLASDDASFVTGSELYIDGGYMAR